MYLEPLLNLEEPLMDPLLWPVQPTHLLIGIENTASVAATALVVQCLWDVSDTTMVCRFDCLVVILKYRVSYRT